MCLEFDPRNRGEEPNRRKGAGPSFPGAGQWGEDLMDEFVREVAEAVDDAAVERALAGASRRLMGRGSARFVPLRRRGLVPGAEAAVVTARPGARIWGWLVADESVAEFGDRAWTVRRRLKTMGMIAAEALDRLAVDSRIVPPAFTRWRSGDQPPAAAEAASSRLGAGDEVFLHAVLPLIFSQAQRYSESLSMLCVAVDRLDGIRALLGAEQADRATLSVVGEVASRIRSCDFAARLGDDRLVVILPRTEIDGALVVAGVLRAAVAEKASLLSAVPNLTVSIGAASYPSRASDLDELRAAAFAALLMAHALGGDRAEPAPAPAPAPASRPALCL